MPFPGTSTTVTAAPPSPNSISPTGTWFVAGQTQQGPAGVAIPITSLTDYLNFCGQRVSYGMLYDALDEFFHDGGNLAYISRVVPTDSGPASVTLPDQGGSPQATLTITAAGPGTWANSTGPSSGVYVTVAAGSAANSYQISVALNGAVVVQSPNLFSPQDAVTWFNAQNSWQTLITITNQSSTNTPPSNNPALQGYALTGGADGSQGAVIESQWTNALPFFVAQLGPGQVSAPGHTTALGWQALADHALDFNRVALLDVDDNSDAGVLAAQAQTVQGLQGSSAATDASYAAFFGPWIIIPGLTGTNPNASSPVPSRTIAPSALAAARMAANDSTNDANVAAAGNPGGASSFAIGVTQTYVSGDLDVLNGAGINVLRPVQGQVSVYGFRSLSLDPNWVFLNNVRFRMQVVNDFDDIGDAFVFAEIDGQGKVFSQFAGALSGKCQTYFLNNSLFGASSSEAFLVNCGPQVNTPASIAAGQINANVLLKMSPFAEQVLISVVKYAVSTPLPVAS